MYFNPTQAVWWAPCFADSSRLFTELIKNTFKRVLTPAELPPNERAAIEAKAAAQRQKMGIQLP
jgi:hypothetical protein